MIWRKVEELESVVRLLKWLLGKECYLPKHSRLKVSKFQKQIFPFSFEPFPPLCLFLSVCFFTENQNILDLAAVLCITASFSDTLFILYFGAKIIYQRIWNGHMTLPRNYLNDLSQLSWELPVAHLNSDASPSKKSYISQVF